MGGLTEVIFGELRRGIGHSMLRGPADEWLRGLSLTLQSGGTHLALASRVYGMRLRSEQGWRSQSAEPPHVSVIIPCLNEASHIETCVRDVLAFREPEGGFEVVVADGMSDDGTREIVEQLTSNDGRCRLVDNPSRTTAAGLNIAIGSTRGEVVARIDAHTRYAPDYLLRCVEVLTETGADNVGGPARTEARGLVQKAVAAVYHSPFAVGGARFHDVSYEGPVDTLPYGCWPQATFERFGLFDEELVRNQDDEHNLRINRGGGTVWQSPSIKSWYSPRSSFRALFRQYLQYGYWKVRVIQKHRLPASFRHLVPGAFVSALCILLLAGFWWVPAWWGLAALTGFYATAVLVASVVTAAQSSWDLFPLLPIVFVCFHFGYGMGFVAGLADFVLLRRKPGASWRRITRATPNSVSEERREDPRH